MPPRWRVASQTPTKATGSEADGLVETISEAWRLSIERSEIRESKGALVGVDTGSYSRWRRPTRPT